MWCATTSCSSRAILVRSSSSDRRARSASPSCSCSVKRRSAPALARSALTVIPSRACLPGRTGASTSPASSVSTHISARTRGRTRSATRARTHRWIARSGPGHRGPPPPLGSAATAAVTRRASESHHPAIGQYSATGSDVAWAMPTAAASWFGTPKSSIRVCQDTPARSVATTITAACGSQKVLADRRQRPPAGQGEIRTQAPQGAEHVRRHSGPAGTQARPSGDHAPRLPECCALTSAVCVIFCGDAR
jgi:hypothetical protein